MMNSNQRQICGLCRSEAHFFSEVSLRCYFHCRVCNLIFVDPNQRVNLQEEREQYEQHRNSMDDLGYLSFQDQLLVPMVQRLSMGSSVLEFGSGPSPVFAQRLEKLGCRVTIYDYFFAPCLEELHGIDRYDAITSVEVIEHIGDLEATFNTWDRLIRPGGLIGVMTLLWHGGQGFIDWWYLRDPTHISFFTKSTIHYISDRWKWEPQLMTNRAVIWQKK